MTLRAVGGAGFAVYLAHGQIRSAKDFGTFAVDSISARIH
jgi:hypothetical protein